MDNAQTGMQARVNVKCPWLAILPLMLGSFVGMFSETSLNIPTNDPIINRRIASQGRLTSTRAFIPLCALSINSYSSFFIATLITLPEKIFSRK